MKRNTKKYRSHCPINFAQETFGDKWSLLIIRDLMFKGKKYYGEFLNSDEKISTNILADRLEKLEVDGLLTKARDKENNSKNIYALTQKGVDLLPMLLEMIAWSAKYDNKTGTPAEFIRRLTEDKDSLIRELIAGLGSLKT
ncbi:MAG: helix-turn-helix transcriptional regulator [Gammaproteobacteria bacterium]|nr:helix-turn-helix transcriptional regulator [Gammaproteobacteria bacterium]MCF6261360.1 helix-turn-helix transcriptional regulator [Gammaproteobacteria bacterium]